MSPADSFGTAIDVDIELTNPISSSSSLSASPGCASFVSMTTRPSSSAFCLLLSSAHNASHTSKQVLNHSALQRRASCDFKRPVSIPAGRFAVTLGHVQRDGLGCAPTMCTEVDPSRYAVLSYARSRAMAQPTDSMAARETSSFS
ncbi:MAG: hypothetical protein N838_01900 [Thiohalocapsa sp. PB-PSB1]|nr:MAG: hypothetical protein N838_01900 [Thiohalocapsa sp. PB-PSB1]